MIFVLPQGNLTPHFTRAELVFSQTAARLGIDNTPPDWVWDNLQSLCEACLEPARQAFGPIIVTSGYRCPVLNAKIPGSARASQHTLGEAADIVPLHISMGVLARWLTAHVLFDQVIFEWNWLHVSHKRTGEQRAQVLQLMPGASYAEVTPAELTRIA